MIVIPKAPILLLIFNRPDLTAQVFARIRQLKPNQLYVAADGYRKSCPGEESICQQTREITEQIDWDCEVFRLYREENLGCKLAVSRAITWFFEQVESGIILEDDCLPSLSFFQFCSELLERYQDRNDMGVIAGTCHLSPALELQESYYFSQYPHIWGWATWRKVWDQYDDTLKDWSGLNDDLKPYFDDKFVRRHWAKEFNAVKFGKLNTWDNQLLYLCTTSKKTSITPSISLITNIGFDERATHTVTHRGKHPLPVGDEIKFPLCHPKTVEINRILDRIDEIESWGIPRNEFEDISKKIYLFIRIIGGKILRFLKLK